VRGPRLNTVLEVWPYQCRLRGYDHLPAPAGHTIPDPSQDAVGLLGHLGTLLAHVQLAVSQHPQVLFRQAAFQLLLPKPVALHGVVVTEVQDLALGHVETPTDGLGPSMQPVQIPLQILPTLEQVDTPTQLGVICKLTEGPLNPSSISLRKMLSKTGPKAEHWGTPLVTGRQLDLTPFTTTLCARPFSQFFIQRRVHPSKPWAASFSRRMLWGTVSKALLKPR